MGDHVTFAAISNGGSDPEGIGAELRSIAEFPAAIQKGQEVASLYRVTVTPSATALDADGRILFSTADGPDEIEALVRLAVRHQKGRELPTIQLGQPA